MGKKIAIIQSNYIPWKGYFDIINYVDEFILFDDVQYTRRDWRNRNIIKTPQGLHWLTIPVEVKGKYFQAIKDTKIADKNWNKKHWQSIKSNYAKTKGFNEYADFFENHYLNCNFEYLSEVNFYFIDTICKLLGITTKIRWSNEFVLKDEKTERLIGICKQANAVCYVSGPSAKGYMNDEAFAKENIKLEYFNYDNYPEYPQNFPPFNHYVSVLDLILNVGKNCFIYLKR